MRNAAHIGSPGEPVVHAATLDGQSGTAAWRPSYALPPGQVLRRVLAERGISQAELAVRTGLSAKHVNQVLQGIVPLSVEMALLLERVLETPSYIWNQLEAAYRDSIVRSQHRERLQTHLQWADHFPAPALIDRGVLSPSDDGPARVEKILSFFGVADPDAYEQIWDQPMAVFRRSRKFSVDPYATATWLRLAEVAAGNINLSQYDGKAFQRIVPQLRELTIPPLGEAFPELQRRCAEVGIAVVREPQLPNTRVCGATRWINASYPIIVLSGRYKTEDSLWFSFFHEAGHVLLHPKRTTYIAPDERGDKDDIEHQADNFAQQILIPAEASGQLARLRTNSEIELFARQINIGVGVVAGRLMNDGRLNWSRSGRLRRRLGG
ncbi:ImmA/IrrE family metallo-endopeptidase [Dactylosporangium sp. CA-152071]|uniref:ImmA/IrrE family metallo-endopeptidase n=1 Tax=Dactylosporangium sp. CA-152071 TaxID=3239933 RepID=UPI003D8D79E8